MASEAQPIVYETLAPLGGWGDGAAEETEPISSTVAEPYFVLRNEISSSAAQCQSPEVSALDYFSIELDETVDKKGNSSANPIASPLVEKDALDSTELKTLEGSWFHPDCRIKSPMLRLHKEIIDFSDFLSPTPEEQKRRMAAIETVFRVIKFIWPRSQVEVFGSFKTGLYLPSSDIDIVILGSNVENPATGLQALSKALSRGIAKKIQVISKARVPIIKFVEKLSGFAFDISFDVSNGPKSAEFVKHVMSKWPPLRPLCLILKVFLQQRELNEVYTGGIGSYALLSMLIAMLRSHKDHQGLPEHNLGVLLVSFFEMYGCKLNTADVGVSCNGDLVFYQKHKKGFSGGGIGNGISIEDPQAPDNDIGKSSFNYYRVKSAFAMAFTTLTNTKAIGRLGPNQSILGAIIRPDAVLLKRKGGSNGNKTLDSVLPGAGEPLQLEDDNQDIYCNWTMNDDDEPLPRGLGIHNDSEHNSSEKKRKKASIENGKKKLKENGSPGSRRYKNGSQPRPRFRKSKT